MSDWTSRTSFAKVSDSVPQVPVFAHPGSVSELDESNMDECKVRGKPRQICLLYLENRCFYFLNAISTPTAWEVPVHMMDYVFSD